MEGYLVVENLSFTYPHYRGLENSPVFENISFSVEKGETAVFLAPPESGKTTLSRILTALVPRYTGGILGGKIMAGETDIRKEKPYNLISLAGIVFQNPEEQIITPDVESEIGFSLEAAGHDYEHIKHKTDEALEKVSITNLRGMNTSSLSGGEKRKLLFAALAAADPDIWILDETFEEIDPEGRLFLLDFLKTEKKTVLILTSKMLDIYGKYSKKFFLYDGKTLTEGKDVPSESFLRKAKECGVILDPEKLARNVKKSKPSGRELPVVLKAENLFFRYPGSDFSLSVKDFSLRQGEVTVLIGKNGSGKSTLARIVSGLIRPDGGRISIEKNTSLAAADPDTLNRNVSYLFQNPDYQLFLPTVGEELMFGLKSLKCGRNEKKEMVERTARLFRLENLEAPPAIMSYGARKRLQAAIYYLLKKKIVIIDEADSGLSFNDYSLILNAFRSLDPPPAVMVISHDIKLAAGIADMVAVMDRGALLEGDSGIRVRRLLDISCARDTLC